MKYATSPSTSRCSSPVTFSSGSPLPTPITYRHNCMGAATKCYKYLRKLLKFQQMDFEFAAWQMVFLLASPQKVYRNFQNRKQTKQQFARDDPAFLVLLAGWLSVSSVGFAIVLGLNFLQFLKFTMYAMFVDCIFVALCVATVLWFVTNRFLLLDRNQDFEWGYAFDIHLNAFFPPLVILNFLQLFVYHALINSDSFVARFFGNSFWLVGVTYYVYITFLGYSSTGILHRTADILWALPVALLLYIIFLCAGINVSKEVMSLYYHRVA